MPPFSFIFLSHYNLFLSLSLKKIPLLHISFIFQSFSPFFSSSIPGVSYTIPQHYSLIHLLIPKTRFFFLYIIYIFQSFFHSNFLHFKSCLPFSLSFFCYCFDTLWKLYKFIYIQNTKALSSFFPIRPKESILQWSARKRKIDSDNKLSTNPIPNPDSLVLSLGLNGFDSRSIEQKTASTRK